MIGATAQASRFVFRRCGITVAALAVLWAPSALRAQEGVAAVPEFLEVGDAGAGSPASAELARAHEAYRTRLTDDPEGALEMAKQIVALVNETSGASREPAARALINLAIVQAETRQFGAAIDNYKAAIALREQAAGTIVSSDLINPLRGLAAAYLALDDIEQAIPVLERAIHVSHVNYGPENPEQVELVNALSNAYVQRGDLEEAGELQDAIFRLRERRSYNDPEAYYDALGQRAAWYAREDKVKDAVRFRQKVVTLITEQYGANDSRLVEPLVALANATSRTIDQMREPFIGLDAGKLALRKAVGIARSNPDVSPERLARTLVAQGDWFTIRYEPGQARGAYLEAWRIFDDDPALHDVRDALFANPRRLVSFKLRPIYGMRADTSVPPETVLQEGFVEVAFDLDTFGRPRRIRVRDAEPAGIMDRYVRKIVRKFRYRPAIEDGRPRTRQGLTYRHTFRYDDSKLTARDRWKISKTTYETEG